MAAVLVKTRKLEAKVEAVEAAHAPGQTVTLENP